MHDITRSLRIGLLFALVSVTGFSCPAGGWIKVQIPEGKDGFAHFLDVEAAVERAGFNRTQQAKGDGSDGITDVQPEDRGEVYSGFISRDDPRTKVSVIWCRKGRLIWCDNREILVSLVDYGTVAPHEKSRPASIAQFEILRKTLTDMFGENFVESHQRR